MKTNCARNLVLLVDQRFQRNLGLDGCGLVIGRRLDFENVSRWSFAFLAAVHQAGDDQGKDQDGADDNGGFDAGGLAFEPGGKPWKTQCMDIVTTDHLRVTFRRCVKKCEIIHREIYSVYMFIFVQLKLTGKSLTIEVEGLRASRVYTCSSSGQKVSQ